MTVESTLAEARAAAREISTGYWVVRRKVGETEDGLTLVPDWAVIHRGPARLRSLSQVGNVNDRAAGQGAVTVQDSQLSLDSTAPSLLAGDVATCIRSLEPGLAGRHWRIEQPSGQREQASASRHRVRELLDTRMPPIPGP